MRILIDADGCPVVDGTIKIAKQFSLACLILCDTSHRFEREGAQTLVFSKGARSAAFWRSFSAKLTASMERARWGGSTRSL